MARLLDGRKNDKELQEEISLRPQRLEEYVGQDGSTKTRTRFDRPRSIGEHKEVKPKVRLLNGKYVDYQDYQNNRPTTNETSQQVTEIDPADLPF